MRLWFSCVSDTFESFVNLLYLCRVVINTRGTETLAADDN